MGLQKFLDIVFDLNMSVSWAQQMVTFHKEIYSNVFITGGTVLRSLAGVC